MICPIASKYLVAAWCEDVEQRISTAYVIRSCFRFTLDSHSGIPDNFGGVSDPLFSLPTPTPNSTPVTIMSNISAKTSDPTLADLAAPSTAAIPFLGALPLLFPRVALFSILDFFFAIAILTCRDCKNASTSNASPNLHSNATTKHSNAGHGSMPTLSNSQKKSSATFAKNRSRLISEEASAKLACGNKARSSTSVCVNA
mmetsp:Transcript_5086/g.7583  ORF Transcript_5086/g.7583 Transcript_5086/m.7583 type:complete len:200 (-) Transcript_5086:957-1556(-)